MDLAALADRLRRHVATLAGSPRPPGSPAHQAVAAYIGDHLRQAAFEVSAVPFMEAGFAGVNLVTRPAPARSDLPLVLVGAHYDSCPSTPGADDNASGVAALLELATHIAPRLRDGTRFTSQLQLVSYDLEESGIIGSYVHAGQLRKSRARLQGMISLEMLGFTAPQQRLPAHLAALYPSVGNFIGVVGNEASQELLRAVTAAMQSVAGLPVESLMVPGNGEALYEARLSDHSPFWDNGFPALMITDTSFFRNPHYHRTTDTPDTLDYPFFAKVTAGVCHAVEALVTGSA